MINGSFLVEELSSGLGSLCLPPNMYTCICVYIAREREREIYIYIYMYRERDAYIHTYLPTYIYIYIHIYIYVHERREGRLAVLGLRAGRLLRQPTVIV